MRTQAELAQYIHDRVKEQDPLGWSAEALTDFIPYEHAKPFLREGYTEEEWNDAFGPYQKPYTEEVVTEELVTYMNLFGFDKALNHRGISASRTVEKVRAWCYALGRMELVHVLSDERLYPQYGAPMLSTVAQEFGIPEPDCDEWRRMRMGLPCTPDCDEGCRE